MYYHCGKEIHQFIYLSYPLDPYIKAVSMSTFKYKPFILLLDFLQFCMAAPLLFLSVKREPFPSKSQVIGKARHHNYTRDKYHIILMQTWH